MPAESASRGTSPASPPNSEALSRRVTSWSRTRCVCDVCVQAGLLVIDEFGQEKVTEWAASELFSILNARYAAKRPLLLVAGPLPLHQGTRFVRGRG